MPKKAAKKSTSKKIAKPAKRVAEAKVVENKITETPIRKVSRKFSFTIIVYWIVIAFFIFATAFILIRGYKAVHTAARPVAEAMTSAQIAQDADHELALRLVDRGRNSLLAGRSDDAIVDLSESLNIVPENVWALIYRAEAFMQKGNLAAAAADIDEALAVDPGNSVAYYDKSLIEIKSDNFAAALANMNLAIFNFKRNPNEILSLQDMFTRRAQLNLWSKNWATAIDDYTEAMDHASRTSSGHIDYALFAGRAEARTALGDFEGALKDYSNAITVIAADIQDEGIESVRESMSRAAMSFFEKSGALDVKMGNMSSAATNLESAYSLAIALNDMESANRLKILVMNLK
jgi:tetratricopeptide (TPR) repeat protein